MHSRGIEIDRIAPKSIAEAGGLMGGDLLLSINNHALKDGIDFMFYKDEPDLDIIVMRNGKKMPVKLSRKEGEDIGIVIKPMRIKRCGNKCIFCFVSQLPKGMRESLYIKDEDYRMSFLYGNYITLTNLTAQDKKRIVEQHLSPLYISVHSTNKTVRNALLNNPRACNIMKELKFLKEHKIRMHTQIVLCPGYNDGRELQSTIRDLYSLYPYVSSIAVVPVGLTMHRKREATPPLQSVEKEDAANALAIIETFQKRFKKKHGDSIIYASDELYIKAGANFPSLKEYGELPQIENGVGMVPLFMSRAKRVKTFEAASKRKQYLTFTGLSFYPYLKKITERLFEKEGIGVSVIPVENDFFGRSVTVAGLLTGKDVIRAISNKTEGYECLLIPDIVFKDGKNVFLDDVSKKDIEKHGFVVLAIRRKYN